MAGSRDKYTPEQRREWGARQDAMRAQAKAQPAPAPKGHNTKHRARTLVADTDGSTAIADLRWRQGQVYYEFTNGYSYSDPMDKETFKDWRDADSLGEWFNKNWK